MTPTNEDAAYAALRTAILSLELMPGERLSERALEATVGSSRTPIRAALTRLENEGLTRREGRSWQVTPIDVTEVREVMEYREALETAAVALAVERADADGIAALRAIAQVHGDGDDEETGLRDGADFHVALARLSGNRFLAEGMTGAMTRLFRTRWLEVRTAQSRSQARAEHAAIADAVAAHDDAAATALVVAHGRGVRDRLLELLAAERRRLRARGVAIVEAELVVSDSRARV